MVKEMVLRKKGSKIADQIFSFTDDPPLMVVLKVKSLKLQILVNSAADADTGSSVDFV